MQFSDGRGARRAAWLCASLWVAASVPAHAGTGQLLVTAVVLSKSNCSFRTTPTTLAFGAITPTSGTAANASTTIDIRCTGGGSGAATYSLTAANGLYFGSGSRRVRHATITTEFMAYSLNLSPAAATIAKNATQTITITGSIQPVDFQNAAFGSYSDTVVLNLLP